jgi:hypothetical protein
LVFSSEILSPADSDTVPSFPAPAKSVGRIC